MPQNVTWNGVTYPIPLAGELNWSSLSTFLIDLGTYAAVAQEAKQTIRVAVTTPVTVAAATDYAVITDLTSPGAVAVTLPAGVAGQIFIIVDGKGDAATNNITITPNGAETIKGAANLVMNSNRQTVMLGYDVGTTDWKLLEYAIPVGGVVPADITGVIPPSKGGTGVANNDSSTVTITGPYDLHFTLAAATAVVLGGSVVTANSFVTNGNFPLTLTTTASTSVTLPITGTLATLAGAETLTNKSLTAAVVTDYEDFTEISLPSPPATGKVRLYSKADGNMYQQDETGLETKLSGGSGTSFVANVRPPEGGGTVTLTNSDIKYQIFDLTAAETVVLPATGVLAGDLWTISERTALFPLEVQAADTTVITTLQNSTVRFVALTAAPATNTDWQVIETKSVFATQTDDVGLPGYVGEDIQVVVVEGSSISVTSGGGVAVISIALEPGDYDLNFNGQVKGTQGAGVSNIQMGISTVAGDTAVIGSSGVQDVLVTGTYYKNLSMTQRISIGTPLTFFLNMFQDTGSTWQGWGRLSARRSR